MCVCVCVCVYIYICVCLYPTPQPHPQCIFRRLELLRMCAEEMSVIKINNCMLRAAMPLSADGLLSVCSRRFLHHQRRGQAGKSQSGWNPFWERHSWDSQSTSLLTFSQSCLTVLPDSPTSLIGFILFTGHLLSRGSNTCRYRRKLTYGYAACVLL